MLASLVRSTARRRAGLPPAPAPHRRGAAVLEFCLSLLPWAMMLAIMLDIVLISGTVGTMDATAWRVARHAAIQGGPGQFTDPEKSFVDLTKGFIQGRSGSVLGGDGDPEIDGEDIAFCMTDPSSTCDPGSRYVTVDAIRSEVCDATLPIVAVHITYRIDGFLIMDGGPLGGMINLSDEVANAFAADRCYRQ